LLTLHLLSFLLTVLAVVLSVNLNSKAVFILEKIFLLKKTT